MHRHLLAVTALAGVLGVGCGEQQAPTTPNSFQPLLTAPSAAPGGGGAALVERGTLDIGIPFSDEESGLTTVIGNSFAELAVLCAGGTAPSGMPVLIVTRPTGAVKLLLKNPETEVVVWQLVSDDFCGVLATTQPYAEGTARLTITDNDIEFPIEPGGNASTIRAVGRVTVAGTGEELQYQAFLHSIVPPGGTDFDDIQVIGQRIRLH